MLPSPIALQSLKSVSGRCPKIDQRRGGIQVVQLSQRDTGDVAEPAIAAVPHQRLGVAASERLNRHLALIYYATRNRSRGLYRRPRETPLALFRVWID